MDTNSFKKKNNDSSQEDKENKEVDQLSTKLLSKDDEIKQLKKKLSEAQKVNKIKKGDIRAEVNSEGDVKMIKIGLTDKGKPIWKPANKLTDADIKRREEFIRNIKQMNAKKNQ